MTTYLDASALVALLLDEPAAAEVQALLMEGTVAVSVLNYGEALDTVGRTRSIPADEVGRVVRRMVGLSLALEPAGVDLVERGAALRVRYYHRSRCPVSLADCVAIAAARGAALATADGNQATVAREEGVEVIDLPPSTAR